MSDKKSQLKFEKTELSVSEPQYSEEEIQDFLEECGKRPRFTIKEFTEVLKKEVEDLTYRDVRVLVSKVGWLDDTEREKFQSVLFFENLTEPEKQRYHAIYPNRMKFDKYFPAKADNA